LKNIVQKIPFLRILTGLTAGIFAGSLIDSVSLIFWILAVSGLAGLILLHRLYCFRLELFFGALITLTFIFTGITVFQLYNKRPAFYTGGKYQATILDIPRQKKNSCQALLKLEKFYCNDSIFRTDEKVMAWFESDSRALTLTPGERIYIDQAPRIISGSTNPFEFDYKRYLERKRIYRQVYLSSGSWIRSGAKPELTPVTLAERFRLRLLTAYKNMDMGDKELHILSALTLGYKKDLEPEIKDIFASAGAMHVLAVSGLHTGIIYMIITFCFGFLNRNKAGRLIFLFIVLSILWMYVFITGLSPSVSRASLMFSFVAVGNIIRRPSNIYNTLAASAFFLLLVNPNNLFDAGFRLSYSAVFGIVFLQPRFLKIFNIRYRIVRYFWTLITVSVAAQVTTFPLSIYYFNQFPVYFWISGLFLIPLVTVLIPLGFFALMVSGIPLLSGMLAGIANYLLNLLIRLLDIIEKMPMSVINLYFSPAQLLIIICILISLFIFIYSEKKIHLKATLLLLIAALTVFLASRIKNLTRKEIIVYDTDDLVVHLITGKSNYIISENELRVESYEMDLVMNTISNLNLNKPEFLKPDEKFKDNQLLLKDNICFFEGKILQISDVGNMLPDYISPGTIITDSRNPLFPVSSDPDPQLIITGERSHVKFRDSNKVYYLRDRGAYRGKW
jgi:competence protein ComEC